MNITVERSKVFLGTTTVHDLERGNRGNITYYRILNNNRHMAILSRSKCINNINTVVVVEKQKMPLWKQDMQMRMGRKPKDIETRKVLRVQEINTEEASKYRIEAYETIF